MIIKRAITLQKASIIDRDMLLFGPKKASFIKHEISENLIHANKPIDLIAELEEKNAEDWMIFRARAIDAGGLEKTGEDFYGANDNGDYFSEEELLKVNAEGKHAFETFIGCSLFTNHKNDDIEQSRGRIVNAFYDIDQHCVYVDGMVDAKAYPQLARGMREGYISDVSMGCSVQYSTCSVCDNKAVSEEDYCLVPGTKVTLGSKELLDIEMLKVGQEVLTLDGTGKQIKEVMERNIDEEIYEIYVSGSNIPLEITGNHPVYCLPKMEYKETFDKYYDSKFNPDFVNAEDLNIEDYLLSPKYNRNKTTKDTTSHWVKNGFDIVKIRKIVKKHYSGPVFNLSVEENENYIANNVIVHNCSHIKNSKARKIGGKTVYERNYGIKFIELSAVTDGACENCTIQNVYTGPELLCKLQDVVTASNAELQELEQVAHTSGMLKVASKDIDEKNPTTEYINVLAKMFNSQIIVAQMKENLRLASTGVKEIDLQSDLQILDKNLQEKIKESITVLVGTNKIASLAKTAGGEDIDKLNQALDMLKDVAEQILGSKDVDFEFLEDIGGLALRITKLDCSTC